MSNENISNKDSKDQKDPKLVQAINHIKNNDFLSSEQCLNNIKNKNKEELNLFYYVKFKLRKYEELESLNLSQTQTDLYTKQLIGKIFILNHK